MKVIVNEKKRSTYGDLYTGDLKEGKVYDAARERSKKNNDYWSKWLRIIDESGEDYLYHISLFDIIEE